jgi:hypothetical protein
MAKLATTQVWWLVAGSASVLLVALSAAAAGQGPLVFLDGSAARLLRPLFLVGAFSAGFASFRQLTAGPGGRPTSARMLLGVGIGFVGAACWALLTFALILWLQSQLAPP